LKKLVKGIVPKQCPAFEIFINLDNFAFSPEMHQAVNLID